MFCLWLLLPSYHNARQPAKYQALLLSKDSSTPTIWLHCITYNIIILTILKKMQIYSTFATQSWMPSNYVIRSLTELVLNTTNKENSINKNTLGWLIAIFINLNLSCPAVSQICSFTDFPPTLTTLEPNSTPMVWLESCLTENKR